MTISTNGTFTSNGGTGLTTLAVTNAAIGDLVVVSAVWHTAQTIASISGGGVTTWTKVLNRIGTSAVYDIELWYGVVTATGAQTITFTWTGSIAAFNAEYSWMEYQSSVAATWSVDTSNYIENSTSSTSATYPSLTPAASGELYVGDAVHASGGSAMTTAGTSGYTFEDTWADYIYAFNPACSSSTQSPVGTWSGANRSTALGALFIATPTASRGAAGDGLGVYSRLTTRNLIDGSLANVVALAQWWVFGLPVATAFGSTSSTGLATATTTHNGTAIGAVSSTGLAAGSVHYRGTTSGATTSTGTATSALHYPGTAIGATTSTGLATGTTSLSTTIYISGVMGQALTGAWVMGAGGFSSSTAAHGTSAGATSSTGLATGSVHYRATATGATTTGGLATGSVHYRATSLGATTSTGVASGTLRYVGGALGSTTSAGLGTGTSTTSGAGAALGGTSSTGLATGTTSLSTTIYLSGVMGQALLGAWVMGAGGFSSTITVNGTALGATASSGLATGSLHHIGTAIGATSSAGLAAGSLHYLGTSSGGTVSTGRANGTLHYRGTATGGTSSTGRGLGAIVYTGTAAGGATSTGLAIGYVPGTVAVTWATTTGIVVSGANSTRAVVSEEAQSVGVVVSTRASTMTVVTSETLTRAVLT